MKNNTAYTPPHDVDDLVARLTKAKEILGDYPELPPVFDGLNCWRDVLALALNNSIRNVSEACEFAQSIAKKKNPYKRRRL